MTTLADVRAKIATIQGRLRNRPRVGWMNRRPKRRKDKRMSNIKVFKKSGEVLSFPHEGRGGGSYTKTLKFDGAFAIIEDEWGKRTAIPAADIESIEETPARAW